MGSCKSNHILITGPPGIGKTTLISKVCDLLASNQIPTVGFLTKEVRSSNGSRIGFDINTLKGKNTELARKESILDARHATLPKVKFGTYSIFVKQFETVAIPELTSAKTPDTILIIDEVGKMELRSSAFTKEIEKLFDDKTKKILATVPILSFNTPIMVKKLYNDSYNHIITVDYQNRDDLATEIINLLT